MTSVLAGVRQSLLCSTAALILGSAASVGAHAQTLTWSPTGQASGGTGNWNITSSFWYNGNVGPQVWTNGADAVFGGTAGTVTINVAGITAHNLTFNTSGYRSRGPPPTRSR